MHTLRRSDTPFFLAVGFHKPHLPFSAPKKYWDLYDRSAIPPPDIESRASGVPPYAANNWGDLRLYSDIPARDPLSAEKKRELIHGCHACVSYIDAQVAAARVPQRSTTSCSAKESPP